MPDTSAVIAPESVREALVLAGLSELSLPQREKLADYGNLLLRWNGRINLTAIRDATGILQRHIVEAVAAALVLPGPVASLLDYGSGAGLPGIPIAIVREDMRVTLAESQGKKAAFLREAVRSLRLAAIVHGGRVEALPATDLYDAVTLRAVERMPEAVAAARKRVTPGGSLWIFATQATENELVAAARPVSCVRHKLPTVGFLLECRF